MLAHTAAASVAPIQRANVENGREENNTEILETPQTLLHEKGMVI